MKMINSVLLIMILLSLGILVGCNEGYVQKAENDLPKKQVIWEPTQTGFWHLKVRNAETNQSLKKYDLQTSFEVSKILPYVNLQ